MKLIVGVDPGARTGVAVVDISSPFYRTFTVRGFDDACAVAIAEGEPIIIATDKAKMPGFARKVASSFGARHFHPKTDYGTEEKKKITDKMQFSNDHEMDALAAALAAKKEYSRMFEKVDSALEMKNRKEITDEVKELLVKERAANIEHALEMLRKEEKRGVVYVPRWIESKRVYGLKKRIKSLERIIENQNALIKGIGGKEEKRVFYPKPKKRSAEKKSTDIPAGYETVHMPHEDVKHCIFLVKSQKEVRAAEMKEPIMLISDGFMPNTSVPFVSSQNINMAERNGFLAVKKSELGKAFNEAFANYIQNYKRRFNENR